MLRNALLVDSRVPILTVVIQIVGKKKKQLTKNEIIAFANR